MADGATEPLSIRPGVQIDPGELRFTFQRSTGPGGQNVNKTSTRVTLRFDVDSSPSLSQPQKNRIRARLATRIAKDGSLRVVSSRHRTQSANRKAALRRFVELLAEALEPVKPRKATKPPAAVNQRRLEQKRRRSSVKQMRRSKSLPDD